jgi:hypothetical protein
MYAQVQPGHELQVFPISSQTTDLVAGTTTQSKSENQK